MKNKQYEVLMCTLDQIEERSENFFAFLYKKILYFPYNMNRLNEDGDNKLMNKFIADFHNQVYHGTISMHKESLRNGIDINRGFE